MSYHDDLFPKDIAYGARGGPEFNTTVLELASGYEKRNQNWSKARARYNVTYGIRNPDQMTRLLNFFYARRGRAFSFPYFDHKDHMIKNQAIGVGDGSTRTFQIFKRYESGGFYYDRLITKLIPNTLKSVAVGGVVRNPNTYTVDPLTGTITFTGSTSNIPPVGAEIFISEVQFYVHVRFDTDLADIQLVTFGAESWTDIILIEIKEDVA